MFGGLRSKVPRQLQLMGFNTNMSVAVNIILQLLFIYYMIKLLVVLHYATNDIMSLQVKP